MNIIKNRNINNIVIFTIFKQNLANLFIYFFFYFEIPDKKYLLKFIGIMKVFIRLFFFSHIPQGTYVINLVKTLKSQITIIID